MPPRARASTTSSCKYAFCISSCALRRWISSKARALATTPPICAAKICPQAFASSGTLKRAKTVMTPITSPLCRMGMPLKPQIFSALSHAMEARSPGFLSKSFKVIRWPVAAILPVTPTPRGMRSNRWVSCRYSTMASPFGVRTRRPPAAKCRQRVWSGHSGRRGQVAQMSPFSTSQT